MDTSAESRPALRAAELPPFFWASKLLAMRWELTASAIVLLAALRTGIGFYSTDMVEISVSFPDPVPSYKGLSVLSPAIAGTIGISTGGAYLLLHLGLLVLLLIGVVLGIRRRFGGLESNHWHWSPFQYLRPVMESLPSVSLVITTTGCSSPQPSLASGQGGLLLLWEVPSQGRPTSSRQFFS